MWSGCCAAPPPPFEAEELWETVGLKVTVRFVRGLPDLVEETRRTGIRGVVSEVLEAIVVLVVCGLI